MGYVKLYHGSKSEIMGSIKYNAGRELCDFGAGFYTGELIEQAVKLSAGYSGSKWYELSVDLSKLSVYVFTDNLLWALYVGYNRNYIKNKDSYFKLVKQVKYISSHDVVVGSIADDRMMRVYTKFVKGGITDRVLIESMKYIKLGNQYVFKTQKACNSINISAVNTVSDKEKVASSVENSRRLNTIDSYLDSLKIRYRRTGRYFDEILEEYK